MTRTRQSPTIPVRRRPEPVAPAGPNPEPPPTLMTARQLARKLSVGLASLYRMAAAGQLPQPLRLGRASIRWRTAEIDAWLAADAPSRAVWEQTRRR